MFDIQNASITKDFFLVNGAGSSSVNPIIAGLKVKIFISGSSISSVKSYFANSQIKILKGTGTLLNFTKESESLFSANITFGSNPTIIGKNYIRIEITDNFGNIVFYDKEFFVANIDNSTFLKLFETDSEQWINQDELPIVPQQTGVKLFDDYRTPGNVKTFGGAKFVSVYDQGTDEDSTEQNDVVRSINQDIRQFFDIYLVKVKLSQVESHSITLKFKTDRFSSEGVTKDIVIKSRKCFGYVILEPLVN